jgi:5'-nucleotidase / UDP-sugar diphosphatase
MFFSLLLACPHPVAPEVTNADVLGATEIVILHTNDLHGHFLPERAKWIEGEPKIGGFEAIDAWVRAAEARWGADKVLVLDGGDLLTGTPLTDIEVRGFLGGAMLEFLEAVNYDAWVVGNHEFDKGFDNTQAMVSASNIPAVSSNLLSPTGGPALEGLKPSIVIDADGIRVGIIGATTIGLSHLASADTMSRIQLVAPEEAVQAEIDKLDESTDLLVVVSHLGLEADRRLAQNVQGLDVIVGGHSHTPMAAEEVVNGVRIVQAGSYGRSLGEMRFSVIDDAVSNFQWQLLDLVPEKMPGEASETVKALVAKYASALEADFGQVVGQATEALERSYRGSNSMGNWITDVLKEYAAVDIGLYNAGGIRADLAAGPVTKGDIFEIFPFSNAVVTFEISGSELLGILLGNARSEVDGGHGSMQISGASLTWRLKMDVAEVVEILVGGEAFDPDATYTVATNTYVLEQAAKYLPGAVPENIKAQDVNVFDVALLAAGKGPISANSAWRMRRLE